VQQFPQKVQLYKQLKTEMADFIAKSAMLILSPQAERSAKLFCLPFRVSDESDEEKSSTNGVYVYEALLLTGLWLLFRRPLGAVLPLKHSAHFSN